jgi:tRNA pseudouridine13 synthase
VVDASVREQMLAPPAATGNLVGVGGRIKDRCEDFIVDEIPAYSADGREDRHLFIRVRKRAISTPELLRILEKELSIGPHEIGYAGRKDRHAVTTQWLSVPISAAAALERFSVPGIEILEAHPHGQKLRLGHLQGNRFRIVLREPGGDLETARQRVRAKLVAIGRGGGLENTFGAQRFGEDGVNLDRGLGLLASGRRFGRPEKFVVSAAQSGLFNLYVGLRKSQGWLRQVLPGDLLHRIDPGGMFAVENTAAEQSRMDRGELVVSGPIFGAKMRAPAEASPSALLERGVLLQAGLDPGIFAGRGKQLPGSRRPVQVSVVDFSVTEAEAADGLAEGLELRFCLPAGSYATQLVRELQCGP